MDLKHYIKVIRRKLLPKKQFVICDKSVLPARHLRFNGPMFANDAFYLRTSEAEARRLIDRFHCDKRSRVLEIGCGQGRLATGLMRLIGPVNYTGLDVHLPSVNWCRQHIEKKQPSYHFEHLNVGSERYNRSGAKIDHNFKFPVKDQSIDVIYIWGVFTNLEDEIMKVYLNDLKRMLSPGGKIFFTAFAEENVSPVSVNPEGYLFEKYTGPLQVVRYEKNYLFSLIAQAGLVVDDFIYGKEFDGQSEFYLS